MVRNCRSLHSSEGCGQDNGFDAAPMALGNVGEPMPGPTGLGIGPTGLSWPTVGMTNFVWSKTLWFVDPRPCPAHEISQRHPAPVAPGRGRAG